MVNLNAMNISNCKKHKALKFVQMKQSRDQQLKLFNRSRVDLVAICFPRQIDWHPELRSVATFAQIFFTLLDSLPLLGRYGACSKRWTLSKSYFHCQGGGKAKGQKQL